VTVHEALGLLVSIALIVYLLAAVLFPERF
jgi:K+-transporting ATPase KdpF subunit